MKEEKHMVRMETEWTASGATKALGERHRSLPSVVPDVSGGKVTGSRSVTGTE